MSAIRSAERMSVTVVSSGQHPTSFDQGLAAFGLAPDAALPVRRSTGTQPELIAELSRALEDHFTAERPDAVVVQGDTATAFAAGLTAFLMRIPVAHLEAGLRTGDLSSPFPEEGNRLLLSRIARLHLAPTPRSVDNLRREGISGPSVMCVGNTVVDAAATLAARNSGIPLQDARLAAVERRVRAGIARLIVATAHRRDSWGAPLRRVLRAIETLVRTHPDVEVVFPAHPNPAVADEVHAALDSVERVTVTGPLDYPELIRLLSVASLVCSDSGGIQEEAPTFGVPVLVMRDRTERVEAIESGTAVIVGTDEHEIVSWATGLLNGSRALAQGRNPFWDGLAAVRAEQALAGLTGITAERPTPFLPAGTALDAVESTASTPAPAALQVGP